MTVTRQTIQKKLVMDAMLELQNHPTADEVYAVVQTSYPSISKATVYRNLHQLAENGQLRNVFMPDSPARYDHKLPMHYHFRCNNCGRIMDIEMDYMPKLDEEAKQNHGLKVVSHDVVFNGICADCTI